MPHGVFHRFPEKRSELKRSQILRSEWF